jgi:hypothetical protein
LDITHFQYLHGDHHVSKKAQKNPPVLLKSELETSTMGFATTTRPTANDWYRITFQLPGLVILENFVSGAFNNRSFIFIVPMGEHRCRMEFLVMMPKKAKKPIYWLDEVPKFFQQDQTMLAEIQKTLLENADLSEKSVEADVAALWSRKVIASALKNKGLYEFSGQKKLFEFFV